MSSLTSPLISTISLESLPHPTPPLSIEVPTSSLIQQEIQNVIYSMRKNQRWSNSSGILSTYPPKRTLPSSSSTGSNTVSGLKALIQSSSSGSSGNGNSGGTTAGLMSGFMSLKLELREVEDLTKLDALLLLHPFLEVIRSPETSGPITAVALSSIDKFISYSIININSPNLSIAIQELSLASTRCKFEASDSTSDEVVLSKILDVLRNCLTGNVGRVLSDESVCEMMETGLSMCCQMRLSEMLRKSAERTMQAMVSTIFSKLRSIPIPPPSPSATSSPSSTVPPTTSSTPIPQTVDEINDSSIVAGGGGIRMSISGKGDETKGEGEGEKLNIEVADDSNDDPPPPYSLPCIKELLRVLISLLNPLDQQHTDSMRILALGLLNIAFEVSGNSIGKFEELRNMIVDGGCKFLFQLIRSDSPLLLSSSLRVIQNIFDTMRPYLKLQQELLISFLLDRLIIPLPGSGGLGTIGGVVKGKGEIEDELDGVTWARPEVEGNLSDSNSNLSSSNSNNSGFYTPPINSISGGRNGNGGGGSGGGMGSSGNNLERSIREIESRELMLESLNFFCKSDKVSPPSSNIENVGGSGVKGNDLIDLWVNYDCCIEGEDLFERVLKFLCRGVYPTNQGPYLQENSQLLCLDSILGLINCMSGRVDDPPESGPGAPLATSVALSKTNKITLLQGAAAFNLKPKTGLKFLEENGVIYNETNPTISKEESLARFFKTGPRIDKKLLGDFISRPDQLGVLKSFMGLMEFDGKIICDAMRELLEAFRLPGESQQIARITETFAEVYFATNPPDIKSQDAAYILAYSVIMLNTDLHNPQVRKRMDITAYSRNLRGVNDNSDFSPEYLKSIYDSIRKREIVLPEEHQNQVGFEYGWKELLRRTRQAGPYIINTTNEFDKGVFAISWKPIIATMSFAFANFQDDYVVQRSIACFNQCATLAARFDMPEVFDYLILSLSRVTGLLQTTSPSSPSPPDIGNFYVVDIEGLKVTVSPLAVRFGSNVKAQLAAVVLFTIANNNGGSIKEGWSQIFEIYQCLFVHSLLPPSLLQMEDFLSGESVIPLKPKSAPTPREDRRNDGGLLSTLSSYLLSPYGSSGDTPVNEFTDEDIEITLAAVDCIASCRIEELYAQVLELRGEASVAPVEMLVGLMQKMTIDRLRTRSLSASVSGSPLSLSQQTNVATTSRIQLPYDPSAVLLLEVLTSVVSRTSESTSELWPIAFDFLTKVLASANSYSSLFNERVVAALLRLLVVVIQYDELRDSTFLALDMLRSLSPAVLASVAEPLMEGLSKLFVENAGQIRTSTEWNLIFALFSATIQQEEAAKLSFDLMRRLASGQLGAGLRLDNYASFLQVLAGFANVTASTAKSGEHASDDPAMQRGRQIVDILRDTQNSIPNLISSSLSSPSKAWEECWIPLLSAYAHLCLNPARELRQISISSLQRTLLAPEILTNEDVDLTIIFEKVFFPMLEELLKPQVFRRDPDGMGETRLRASALLCKIFLQYLTQLAARQGMPILTDLWLKILGYQDRFMHSGRRDQMYEAVPESLKNVLLVMNASGFLIPPYSERTEAQVALWDATFDRIQPFLPDLKAELFPPPKVPIPFQDFVPPPTTPIISILTVPEPIIEKEDIALPVAIEINEVEPESSD